MEIKKNSETLIYDFAKNVAVLLVVIAHATRMYTSRGVITPLNQSELLANVTEYIYAFHMPLFIFLSGCIYGYCINKGKYKNKLDFVRNKARRLLVPYVFVGLFVVVPVMTMLNLSEWNFLEYCMKGILLSLDSRHLWYLLSLFWIFILAMLLRPLLVKSRICRLAVLSLSVALYLVAWKVNFIPEILQFKTTFVYLIYFFSGVVFKYEFELFEKISQKLYFVYLILPVAFVSVFWLNTNGITEKLYSFVGILMTMGISFCVVNWNDSFTNKLWYKMLKKNSFGIYLFHPMMIYTLFYFLGEYNISPYLLTIGVVIVSIIASILITELIRKLRLGVVIGE